MSTLELKQMLVNKIKLIEDDSYLLAINTLIDSSLNENAVFKLNNEQKNKIEKSIKQAEKGNKTDIDKAFDDIDEWLQKK
jgi:hypothetical protein